MSARAPTPEQAAAIGAAGHDVLVEAGAGTGKTGVMVDRYCRLVCEEGASIEQVLAFTFTDKAAAELRQRIRAELQSRADAGSERARDVLAGIGRAWVTTIHGFCNRVLTAHPVAAGVDPRFRVLDGPETATAAREAFDDALERFLASEERERARTVAAFDINRLRAIVVGAHAELRSRGIERPRLPKPPSGDRREAVRRAAATASATLEELGPANPNRGLVERAVEMLGGTGDELPELDELVALRTESSAKAMVDYREAIEAAVARTAEAGEGGEAYRHIAELLELFTTRFDAAKERRAGVDFEDLQILAARLLERGGVGDSYRARFSHLMVDEFQDTNRLQLRLVEALRGPDGELMVVGDELQSIYGFRHADLEVFRERRRAIEDDPAAAAMSLSGNFRSRPEIVAAVNAIGARLIGDSYRPLRVGRPPDSAPPPGGGEAVELLLTVRDGWDEETIDLERATDAATRQGQLAEARFVAARLRELADEGVERSEMVVLLRAFTHLDAYEDSLERAGLRPYVVGGRGYWSHQQVADVTSLLATIANPLDDQALFGALASPACGVTPDTLWLLRAAAGKRRHAWPAVERAGGGNIEIERPKWLEQIPEAERLLLCDFTATLATLRERGPRLSLSELIDAAVTETGYDLAVLMRPAGEARYANVRKLMRLAAEFEGREGRDLRAFLDFLSWRAEADVEAEAATAVEGHDGVRIMTVHSAKGLEFGVVAVPQLSRQLQAGSRAPLLTIGREPWSSRVGMQLRRLGAASINLFAHRELQEEAQAREAEEELRLFHVAATRASQRLILSGVVKPQPGKEIKPGTAVIERIVDVFDVDRDRDSAIPLEPPLPRAGLEATFEPAEITVRVNLPSPERAAELTVKNGGRDAAKEVGTGPAPIVARHAPTVPNRPLSYTALAAHGSCAYRFHMEWVLGLGEAAATPARSGGQGGGRGAKGREAESERAVAEREERVARGRVVHALLQWSQAHRWREPPMEMARRHAAAERLDPDADGLLDDLLGPVRGWLASELLRDRVQAADVRAVRAEVPLLLDVEGAVLRGAIDLLVEGAAAPLVVDYKTDRLDGARPTSLSARYALQRAIYALAVRGALEAAEVEVAYVFLERPDEPDLHIYREGELDEARDDLARPVREIGAADPQAAPVERRDWRLCGGCPALGRMCSGPRRTSHKGPAPAAVSR